MHFAKVRPMTVSDETPPLPLTAGENQPAPADPSHQYDRGSLQRDAWLDWREYALHIRSWFLHHQTELWLLGPVSLYLLLVCAVAFHGGGLLFALALTALLAVFGPRISADTMLSLYRAEPISPGQGLALRAAIEELSQRAGLPNPPAIAIVPSMAVGAFSVGTQPRVAIMLTEGLLRRYSLAEIVAIAAHELAHIRAGDLAFFSLADVTTRLAQALSYLGVLLFGLGAMAWLFGEPFVELPLVTLLLLAPFLNSQLQLRLPRQREYAADNMATTLLGDTATVRSVALAMEPDFGSLFDDFRLPVPQRRSPIPSPARAHLAGSERVEHLRSDDRSPQFAPLPLADEPLVSLVGVGPIEMRPRNRWPGLWF